jgi:hypothetical protein
MIEFLISAGIRTGAKAGYKVSRRRYVTKRRVPVRASSRARAHTRKRPVRTRRQRIANRAGWW